ncbi:MAG: OmpA family protein [Bacteroidales bacterium]|nr:OmpA family protein [Bacteroidales bacterium]
MKRVILSLFCLVIILCTSVAQINVNKVLNKSKKKAERKVEQRLERRIDKAVDKTLDAAEDGIDDAVKGDDKKDKGSTVTKNNESSVEQNNTAQSQEQNQQSVATVMWSKYDFVPGSEIIFEDDLQGEQNGEFPGKWDLVGGSVENANLNGDNVMMFIKMRAAINGMGIVPLMTHADEDYLSDEFTVEFDAYFELKASSSNYYKVEFFDAKNQKKKIDYKQFSSLNITQNTARLGTSDGSYPGSGCSFSKPHTVTNPGWRHIAISFNKRALKVYFDDARILNIPNLGFKPIGLSLLFNADNDTRGYIKNVRIAKGAVPLYDRLLTDGKFVTTGIKFDVNKATIRPESMGTINYVVKMMKDYPELKFSVEGHTDSDGDEKNNQSLSEKRSQSVLEKLVELGISRERLSSKGYGESIPVAGNDTSEGKAQNRRVEFVKIS